MTIDYNIISVRENGAADDRNEEAAGRRLRGAGGSPGTGVCMMSTFLPAVFGENMMDVFNDFDRDFFRGFGRPEHMLYGKNASRMMKTDVKETEEGYELDVDLPGFAKDEIRLDLANGYLTISTEKNLENKDEKKGRVLRQERWSGTMSRSFYVGEYLTEEDIKARYENGVLSLKIPKKEAPKAPEKKTILIEG